HPHHVRRPHPARVPGGGGGPGTLRRHGAQHGDPAQRPPVGGTQLRAVGHDVRPGIERGHGLHGRRPRNSPPRRHGLTVSPSARGSRTPARCHGLTVPLRFWGSRTPARRHGLTVPLRFWESPTPARHHGVTVPAGSVVTDATP